MNTAFKRWGNKFVPIYQQWLKRPYEFKVFESSKSYYAYPSNDLDLKNVGYTSSHRRILILSESAVYFSNNNKQAFRLLSISKNRCWKCNAVVTERDLVCMTCASVQEPNQRLNFFEIFKETPHFDLDVRNLTVKFRRLQTLLHPDKIASRPEKEKGYSAEQSALVNKAYQTLLRPIERGLYLLELHLKPLDEDSIQLPPDFLTSVLEINETLMECNSPRELESIRHINNAKIQMLYSDVSIAFKEKNIDKARESLSKLKYFINIDEKIKRLEDDLGVSRDD